MTLVERISKFGDSFRGRVEQQLVDYALDYLNFDEYALAFETLCDHLCEYDVPITQTEYGEIMDLGRELKTDLNARRFKYLKGLVH